MNRCNDINYIELRNAKYYWIIAIPDMSQTKEIIRLHMLHMNIFGEILLITWLKKHIQISLLLKKTNTIQK